MIGRWIFDGEDYVVAKESDIMGVVEEAASQKVA